MPNISFGSSTTTFTRYYGGLLSDRGNDIHQTSDGGYILAGESNQLSKLGSDGILIKLTNRGNIKWQTIYGNNANDYNDILYKVIETKDHGFVATGYTIESDSQLLLLKTDANGKILWVQTYGNIGSNEMGRAIALLDNGDILIGGTANYLGEEDMFFLRTDSRGNLIWKKQFDWPFSVDLVRDMIRTSDGHILVTGSSSYWDDNEDSNIILLKLTENGEITWHSTYDFNGGWDQGIGVIETADGHFTVSGIATGDDGYSFDMVLFETDLDGSETGLFFFDGGGDDAGFDLMETPDGGYLMAGSTDTVNGASDLILTKINNQFMAEWTQFYGDDLFDRAYAMDRTSDGGCVITGYSYQAHVNGAIEQESDILVIKTDSQGKITK
jgi:hypothetical protein